MTTMDRILGKAGRLAFLVPTCRPFVSALWGAMAGAKAAAHNVRREAPPGQFAAKRFTGAARWLSHLLDPGDEPGLLPLVQIVQVCRKPPEANRMAIQFDASPWGGGAILLYDHQPLEYWYVVWDERWATSLQTSVGIPDGQTSWEFLTLVLSLCTWASSYKERGLAVLGDNIGALSGGANLRGKGPLAAIARELAWRKVRLQWRFATGHLPSEANTAADALSRLHAPSASAEHKDFPAELLKCKQLWPPTFAEFWAVGTRH